MQPGFGNAPRWRCAVALVVLTLSAGCGRSDDSAELAEAITPPATWQATPPTTFTVPGTPLAAWKGPQGSSLVVYRSLPVPEGTADALATELANRLEHLPGLQVVSQKAVTLGGQPAARVEATAPGTGAAFAPSGTGVPIAPKGKVLIPTHRLALAFPRPEATLWITWHYPEAAKTKVEPEIAEILQTLRLPPVSRG